jgi:hypothetical protein
VNRNGLLKRSQFFHGAVVGSFDFGWEQAAGRFFFCPVVADAFTADAFSWAWFVGATAFRLILL